MPRLVVLALALVLSLFLVGCGGGEDQTTAPEEVQGEMTTEEEEAPTAEGDAEAGAELFAEQGCGTCHVLADAGSTGTTGPNLDETQPSFDAAFQQIQEGGGGMPAYGDTLSEDQIADLAAYVSERAGG